MNHWRLAIDSHAANHREVDHVCADVSTLNPKYFPRTDILLTSPACTTYSPAAAINQKLLRQPSLFHPDEMDDSIARSRATRYDVVRWARYHDHEAIIVENVPQIRTAYLQWEDWLNELRKLGYRIQFCHFNSRHFHPIPQSRDRVYIVLTKLTNPAPDLDYRPEAFCPTCTKNVESVQTWKDGRNMWGKYGLRHGQYFYACPVCRNPVEPYYYCAANIIDWSVPMQKVGDRARQLSERTIDRIRFGLRKFSRPYIVEAKRNNQTRPLTDPVGTVVAGGNHHFLAAQPACILEQRGREFPVRGLEETIGTVVGSTVHHYLACDPFLFNLSYGGRASALTEPVPAQTTQTDKWLAVPPFAMDQFGRQDVARALTEPGGTVVSSAHPTLVCPPFMLDKKGPQAIRSLAEPMSTQAGTAQIYLCQPPDPASAGGNPFPGEEPEERPLPPVEECGYRMFEPHEIKRAMGFPDDYIVLGSKDRQVEQLGNAVTPDVPRWILDRVVQSLSGSR